MKLEDKVIKVNIYKKVYRMVMNNIETTRPRKLNANKNNLNTE